MRRPRVIGPEMPEISPQDRLDRSIVEAVKQYVAAPNLPETYLDVEKKTPKLIQSGLEEGNDAFLRIVFLCDIGAQLEDEETVGADPELKWVTIARGAFERAGVDRSSQLLTRLLSDNPVNVEDQRGFYHDMASRLVDPRTLQSVDTGIYTGAEQAELVVNPESDLQVEIEYTDYASWCVASRERL